MREIWRWGLDALWVFLAAVTTGTFVATANLADYRPVAVLDVGATIIGISLLVGAALGVLHAREEPETLILKSFVASLTAIVIVGLTVYAPVLAGTVADLEELGTGGLARLASIFTALFIVPVQLVGSIIGLALADVSGVRPDRHEKGGTDRT